MIRGKTNTTDRKADVLERLNHSDLELCTNFGIDAPKPGSKDKFYVSLVVRPELIDTPITVILKKGIRAKEAEEALKYVADIIADANKAAGKAKVVKRVAEASRLVRFVVHTGAILTSLFFLPGILWDWLVNHVPKL